MKFNNDTLPINILVKKINSAAEKNQDMTLSADEVKLLSEEIGGQYFIPVLSNDQLIQMCREGKLGQPILPKKD